MRRIAWKRWIAFGFFAVAYTYVSTSILLFHGPWSALREYVVESLATSRHGYLLRPLSLFTLSDSEIRMHSANLASKTATPTSLQDYSNVQDPTITIDHFSAATFSADIMLIRDPNRVKVEITKYLGSRGETVSEMVAEAHGVAGINAGAFEDVQYRGTGGIPLGITIHNGVVLNNDQSKWSTQPVIGLTDKGQLICGVYSLSQLREMHVTEACSFGPVLVQDGVGVVQGLGGWGYAPRTAIGQRADGTIIFIVTDGRFIHGPNNVGASLKDIQDLMLHYGAVTAANLDGGSSTTMVYDGKLVNQPTDVLGEREVATAFVVLPPRR